MDYKDVLNSAFVRESYLWIKEAKKDFPVDHSLKHINHVIEYAKKLSLVFDLTEKETELLLISATLHDIGYIKGRENHAENGEIVAKEFLKKHNFSDADTSIISHAILHHGGKDEYMFENKVSFCLAFADKIDYAKDRYSNNTKQHPEVLPYMEIIRNEVELNKSILTVKSYVTENFNENLLINDFFFKKFNIFLNLIEKKLHLTTELKFILEK